MRKLLGIVSAAALVVGASSVASAEGEGPNWTFGAATSYVWDINDPNGGFSGFNSLSYSNQELRDQSFNIDLLQLGISGERGAASYGATLDFGDLAAMADNSSDADIALQTAWLGYDMDMVGVTAGRIATPIGYEVLEPWGNATISRSYGWQAQPINHDGVTAHATLDSIELMVGAVNNFTVGQTAATVNDSDNRKGVIWAVSSGLSDALNAHFAGIFTDDFGHSTETLELNGILHGDLEPSGFALQYAVEYTYLNVDPDGSGGSPFAGEVDLNSIVFRVGTDVGPTGIDIRYEYLDDEGFIVPVSTKIHSFTFDLTWALVDGMDFRVEYRHDEADDNVYGDDATLDDNDDVVQAQLIWYPEL